MGIGIKVISTFRTAIKEEKILMKEKEMRYLALIERERESENTKEFEEKCRKITSKISFLYFCPKNLFFAKFRSDTYNII